MTKARQPQTNKKIALKNNSKVIKKASDKVGAKWDLKKVRKGDLFSCMQYMKVKRKKTSSRIEIICRMKYIVEVRYTPRKK